MAHVFGQERKHCEHEDYTKFSGEMAPDRVPALQVMPMSSESEC